MCVPFSVFVEVRGGGVVVEVLVSVVDVVVAMVVVVVRIVVSRCGPGHRWAEHDRGSPALWNRRLLGMPCIASPR